MVCNYHSPHDDWFNQARTHRHGSVLTRLIEETRNALEAIRAIQNEGTRTEVAQNFRQNGNEHTKVKRWFDGKEFYTQAIGVLLEKEDRWDKPEDPVAEEKLRKELLEACYANRALCHLALGKYSRSIMIETEGKRDYCAQEQYC